MTTIQLSHLAETYGTSIYSFCCHLTGNKDDAYDLYQETFLRAVELSEKLKPDKIQRVS